VERANMEIRKILRDIMLDNENTNWVDNLRNVEDFKNNTYTSGIDNIPNKIIDSFSWAKPVLCSLSGETKKIILKENVGICYSSVEELIEGIDTLLNNEKKYENMKCNCLNLYKKQFDSEVVYKNLVDSLDNYFVKSNE
jgi:glycosyltransferase involved in cell wall biosynthesis